MILGNDTWLQSPFEQVCLPITGSNSVFDSTLVNFMIEKSCVLQVRKTSIAFLLQLISSEVACSIADFVSSTVSRPDITRLVQFIAKSKLILLSGTSEMHVTLYTFPDWIYPISLLLTPLSEMVISGSILETKWILYYPHIIYVFIKQAVHVWLDGSVRQRVFCKHNALIYCVHTMNIIVFHDGQVCLSKNSPAHIHWSIPNLFLDSINYPRYSYTTRWATIVWLQTQVPWLILV